MYILNILWKYINIDELKDAITFAKNKNLSILFLGGGSNILFTKKFELF